MEEGNTNKEAHAEATISPKALEDAMQNALKLYLPRLESTGSGVRAQFYNKFKREADEYDNDFLEKYRGDLDTTLIFAGLFSAVTSAFIVAIQTQLQPDYTQLSYDVLWMMANSTGLNPPAKPSSDSQWVGPDRTLVHTQAILFSSLAASLLAAFVAMLGKQWLNRYSQVEMRGSLMDRSRDRQRKMNGMATWGFKFVMESLPLMLQGSLLLLGCALSKYLFTVDNLIAWVVVGFTASGSLFYLVIVIAATISYDCPFQTPLSLIIRFMVRLFNERKKYLKRSRRRFLHMFLQERRRWRRQPGEPYRLAGFGGLGGNEPIQLTVVNRPHLPPVPFERDTDRDGYVLDSNCIAWMFEMSMDPDVILHILKFIPEIIWHDGIRTTPLEKLYDTILECFDRSSGRPIFISKFKNKAYLSSKALVHLAIQRRCMGNESDMQVLESLSRRHRTIGPWKQWGDSNLDHTLGMLDCVFGVGGLDPKHWRGFSFTGSHLAWMAHILPYRAWHALRNDANLPDDISEFLRYSSRQHPLPPAPIISGCLFIICLALGVRPDPGDRDQFEPNESQKIRCHISKIYKELAEIFRKTDPAVIQIDLALEAMELVAALLENEVASENYELCRVLMVAPVSSVFTEERKWEASRFAMHAAYKLDGAFPQVKDPRPILLFLSYHLRRAIRSENYDEPIQTALRALASASTPETIRAFNNFDSTQPYFVHGICHVFQEHKPLQLRKAVLSFLPLIADKWFNTRRPIMNDNEMKGLCTNWASAVDEVWGADGAREPVLTVLLVMINSPHWRPHVVRDKLKLLDHSALLPDDSQALGRCLENPDAVDAILKVANPDTILLWSKVLWLKYEMLTPAVREKLEVSARGADRDNVALHLSVIEGELEVAERELVEYGQWSNDSKADALRAKIQSHKAAMGFLRPLCS